jgi:hypothetical protein
MVSLPQPITYSMTDQEIEYIKIQAREICDCFIRGRGRSFEECFAASHAGGILEFALCHQGATKNPKQFNIADADSYAWDVIWDNGKTEVKRKRFLSNEKTRWYSYTDPNYVKTFLKNIHLVDYFVVGDYKILDENVYEVHWMFITRVGKNFKNYMQKSMYNEGQMVYYHTRDKNYISLMGAQS